MRARARTIYLPGSGPLGAVAQICWLGHPAQESAFPASSDSVPGQSAKRTHNKIKLTKYPIFHPQDDLENRRTWTVESASNPKKRRTGGNNRRPREEAASYARWHPPGRRFCCRRSPSLPLPVRRLLLRVPPVGLGLGERGSTELALKHKTLANEGGYQASDSSGTAGIFRSSCGWSVLSLYFLFLFLRNGWCVLLSSRSTILHLVACSNLPLSLFILVATQYLTKKKGK